MGIGYTIDTPVKVAHLGIDSVISMVDDMLIEKMRKFYCEQNNLAYTEIDIKTDDHRAKRITAYLNLLNQLVNNKLQAMQNFETEHRDDVYKYFKLLPDSSPLKQNFNQLLKQNASANELSIWLKGNLKAGSIDVNIMTKIDKDNYKNGKQLPIDYNDGHAAIRGFAQSEVDGSVVLSAGMNPRLYGFMEKFDAFYPDENGNLNKKIVLKVSDYRSALIQGKFLAKKGLWVSEYRVESGLNCGGHAFATDGYLMGPILAEFNANRSELTETVHELLENALRSKNRAMPKQKLPLKITAQGGVGTAEEHLFLMDAYSIDSVGWGTPFMLVPEVVAIDTETITKLANAKENDLYLSNISPLGVLFNNLRNNTKDQEKQARILAKTPGSTCPKRYVALNNEFTDKGICSASRQYQQLKIEQLKHAGLSDSAFKKEYNKVVEKACICVGLGTSALLANGLNTKTEGMGVSVCPGPNMAYFSKQMTLEEMVGHIYGRQNVIERTDRPNFFIKELGIYIDYIKNKRNDATMPLSAADEKYFRNFEQNLRNGIDYYQHLFENTKGFFEKDKAKNLQALTAQKMKLEKIMADSRQIKTIELKKVAS
jgi:hypothetical protein